MGGIRRVHVPRTISKHEQHAAIEQYATPAMITKETGETVHDSENHIVERIEEVPHMIQTQVQQTVETRGSCPVTQTCDSRVYRPING